EAGRGSVEGLPQLCLGRIGVGAEPVLAHRLVEQEDLLRDVTDALTPGPAGGLGKFGAVQAAGSTIVSQQADGQAGCRAITAARRSDDGRGPAVWHHEVDV